MVLMKTTLILFTWITLNTFYIQAQTLTDVARNSSLTWYGIDYTLAKFINFSSTQHIDESVESLKTFTKKKFKKPEMDYDLAYCHLRNSKIDSNDLVHYGSYEIDAEKVKQVVNDYNISGQGYGMLYVVESFENTREKAYVWIVYFNKSDKKIISLTRYVGEYQNNVWKDAVVRIIRRSGKALNAYK